MIVRLLILLAVVFGCLLAAIIWFQPPRQRDSDLVSVQVSEAELLQDSLLESVSAAPAMKAWNPASGACRAA